MDSLHIEGGLLEIHGATKVVSSSQTQAVVETGEKSVIISGNEIEVKKLNLEEGEVAFSGKFAVIKFGESAGKKPSLLKRIFK